MMLYHSSPSAVHGRSGFTLVEMLVVIGITMLLAALAVGYSKAGQNAVTLTVEEAKVSEVILQAKELAINTYGTTVSGAKSCGFGVHFDVSGQTYSLFSYSVPSGTACPALADVQKSGLDQTVYAEYQPSSWNIPLSQGVRMQSANDALADVLFYPPAPTTLICRTNADTGGATPNCGSFLSPTMDSNIYLSTVDGGSAATISVSPEGQVTTF